MHRRDLDYDGLFIVCALLEGIDELTQILNGIYVVVGSGRNSVRTFGNHPGFGDIINYLCAGQMTADAGLCALTHFYLYRRAGVEVFLMNAETP